QPDAGSVIVGGTVQLAYVDQSREALDSNKTVWEEISGGNEQMRMGDRTVNSRAYVGRFSFAGPDQQKKVGALSGGERNRVHLAKLLRSGGNLLLLDEPTNDLDVDTLRALENALLEFPGCAVVISHDRWFLDRIATHVLAFEGDSQVTWFEGNFEAYEKMLADDASFKVEGVEIHIPAGPRLGDLVVQADHVAKGFGDRLLVEDMTFSLPPGGIVGVIGPNGAGKTTLFRMIAGEEEPDDGELRIGDTVQLAYVDQSRGGLDPQNTVWKEISGGHDRITLGTREIASRAYVASFNFRGGDQQKRVGDLSGGERNRLHLAKLLRSGGNLLLLDEPTNDLDVDTLRALEDALTS
ncbi:MAG: ATP-binding cassette domain-containing protein, partial [Chloroflexota bacterium]